MRFLAAAVFMMMGITAGAQDSSRVPGLGLVFDAGAKTLRPIWGIPGSAFYGRPLDVGIEIRAAAIAPGAALVANGDGVYVLRLGAAGAAVLSRIGAAGGPDLLAISNSGNFGAAYYAARKAIAIIGPLSSEKPLWRESVAALLPGVPESLAVSDSGDAAMALVSTGDDSAAGGVWRIDTKSGDARLVAATIHGASIALLPGGRDAVVADDGDDSVSILRDIGGAGQRVVLLAGDERLSAPAYVQVFGNGSRVVAAGANGQVAVLDVGGGSPVFLNCNCRPSMPRGVGGGLFVISEVKDRVAWMLEWDPANPRILFVPPEEDVQ